MKRIGLYFRVSTADQTTEPQRLELLAYCARREWTDLREYSDKISGAKWTRFGLDMLMSDVRKGKLDAVLVVKLDRMGRSVQHLAQIFGEMADLRCALICTSQGIDTSDDSPCGKFQRAMMAAVAELERDMIRERTKAGLAVARANGKTLGRPRFVMTGARADILAAWKALPEDGRPPLRALAGQLGCSLGMASGLTKTLTAESSHDTN